MSGFFWFFLLFPFFDFALEFLEAFLYLGGRKPQKSGIRYQCLERQIEPLLPLFHGKDAFPVLPDEVARPWTPYDDAFPHQLRISFYDRVGIDGVRFRKLPNCGNLISGDKNSRSYRRAHALNNLAINGGRFSCDDA